MMKKIIIALITSFLIFLSLLWTKNLELWEIENTPNSSFYFIKSWKEKIQLFFAFNIEQKIKQCFHLANVRLTEYQKMLERGKAVIAEKTLIKYQNQLNHALKKAEELKNRNTNVKELKAQIKQQTIQKLLEIPEQYLPKFSEQARKSLKSAIENSQKQIERILEKPTLINY